MKRRIVELTGEELGEIESAIKAGELNTPELFWNVSNGLVYADAEQLRVWREARATDKSEAKP